MRRSSITLTTPNNSLQFLVLKGAHVLALTSFFSGHGMVSYDSGLVSYFILACIKTITHGAFFMTSFLFPDAVVFVQHPLASNLASENFYCHAGPRKRFWGLGTPLL